MALLRTQVNSDTIERYRNATGDTRSINLIVDDLLHKYTNQVLKEQKNERAGKPKD